MSDPLLFLAKGTVLGLAVAAPVGPIGLLCISRTLERGFRAGVAGGLGTALADASFAGLAATGFAAFSFVLGIIAAPLQVIGGGVLVALGVAGWRARSDAKPASIEEVGIARLTAVTFLLTLANPATILSFAAMLAGLGLAESAAAEDAAAVTLGVFTGSLAWWFFLCGLVALLRQRLPQGFSLWVSRISAIILIGFGVTAIVIGLRALWVVIGSGGTLASG